MSRHEESGFKYALRPIKGENIVKVEASCGGAPVHCCKACGKPASMPHTLRHVNIYLMPLGCSLVVSDWRVCLSCSRTRLDRHRRLVNGTFQEEDLWVHFLLHAGMWSLERLRRIDMRVRSHADLVTTAMALRRYVTPRHPAGSLKAFAKALPEGATGIKSDRQYHGAISGSTENAVRALEDA
jgi:hypothetical protein